MTASDLTPLQQQALLAIALAQQRGRPGVRPDEMTWVPDHVFRALADRSLIRIDPTGNRLTLRGLTFVRNANWSAYRE